MYALGIVKPKLIIADVLVLEKVQEALSALDLSNSLTILTLIERKTGYPLVNDLYMTVED